MIKTTNSHKKYWSERKIDWNQHYLSTWNHPHRELIVWALKSLNWVSLWEIGCGPGPNLVKITKELPGKQLGGSDVNADAIDLARKTFIGGKFHVESLEDMLLTDNAVDVILSDAALIYIGPTKIKKVLAEVRRIGRNNIVFCELHETNPFKRWLYRLKTGYNVYNYQSLLEQSGFHNIQMMKIPKEFWPGTPWETYGYIITAQITK